MDATTVVTTVPESTLVRSLLRIYFLPDVAELVFSTFGELCIYTFFIVYLCNMYHMLIYVLFGQIKNGLNAVLSLNHRSNLCVIFVLFRLKYHAI